MTTKNKKKPEITSNNITELLRTKSMSQTELADLALDGDYSLLSKIVNGVKKQLAYTTTVKIARVLGVPVEEVFIYEELKTN